VDEEEKKLKMQKEQSRKSESEQKSLFDSPAQSKNLDAVNPNRPS